MGINKKNIMRELELELARRSFFDFCKLTMPKFYMDSREYLKELCDTMQDFYENKDDEVLVVNVPPRHRQIFIGYKIRFMGIR